MKKLILIASLVFFIFMNVKAQSNDTLNTTKEEIFTLVEQMPEFPGGDIAYEKYIYKTCTKDSISEKIYPKGTVNIKCVIRKDGSVSDVYLIRGVGNKLDDIALSAVKNMPAWIPGKQRGNLVNVMMMIRITFD